jgi:cold-inducible RNA-binding protein
MAKRLFVGSLPYNVTSSQLEELFAQAGKIDSVNLITDRYSGQSKGFAFVEMATEEEAQEAIKKFNNFEFEGRRLVVNEAKPQENKRQDFGGGRNNFSGPKKRW